MLSPISGLMAFFISVLQLPNALRNLADRSKNEGFITYGAFFFLFSMVLGSSLAVRYLKVCGVNIIFLVFHVNFSNTLGLWPLIQQRFDKL